MNGHIIFQYVGRPSLFLNFISIKCVNNWLIYMVNFEGWVGNIPHPHLPLQRHTHVHTVAHTCANTLDTNTQILTHSYTDVHAHTNLWEGQIIRDDLTLSLFFSKHFYFIKTPQVHRVRHARGDTLTHSHYLHDTQEGTHHCKYQI